MKYLRCTRTQFLGLYLSAIALLLVAWLSPRFPLVHDEVINLMLSDLAPAQLLQVLRTSEPHPPGYLLLLKCVRLVSDEDLALRLLSAVFLVAAAWQWYKTISRYANAELGLVVLALSLLQAAFLTYGMWIRSYGIYTLTASVAFSCVLRMLEGEARRTTYVLYSAASAVGLYVFYHQGLLMVIHGVLLVWAGPNRRPALARWVASAGVAAIAFTPWVPSFLAQCRYSMHRAEARVSSASERNGGARLHTTARAAATAPQAIEPMHSIAILATHSPIPSYVIGVPLCLVFLLRGAKSLRVRAGAEFGQWCVRYLMLCGLALLALDFAGQPSFGPFYLLQHGMVFQVFVASALVGLAPAWRRLLGIAAVGGVSLTTLGLTSGSNNLLGVWYRQDYPGVAAELARSSSSDRVWVTPAAKWPHLMYCVARYVPGHAGRIAAIATAFTPGPREGNDLPSSGEGRTCLVVSYVHVERAGAVQTYDTLAARLRQESKVEVERHDVPGFLVGWFARR